MAKQFSLFLPKGANNNSITLVNADGTALKLLFTAGADDSDVDSITVTSSDTVARILSLYVTRGGVDYILGTVTIGAGTGTDGFNFNIDLLNPINFQGLPLNNVGKPYLRLKSGDTLKVAVTTAVTAAKTIYIMAFGQDY